MHPDILRRLDEFIGEKGLRRTLQRDAVVQAAFSTKEHFTAEGLLTMARKIDPTLSRATVYRTLTLLVESGVLREMHFGKDYKFYDPNFVDRPNHNHLICVDCNKIVEFEDKHMEVLEDCITTRLGFSPIEKTLRIEGKCDELRVFGTCKKREGLKASKANRISAPPSRGTARS
jgi:Fur family ferric uptake transcriptional regulator